MTDETQTTQTATTTEDAASTTAQTGTPTGGEQTGQEQQQAAGQQQGQQVSDESKTAAPGAKTDDKADDKSKPAEGAPEEYEFKAPDGGSEFDPQVLGAFSEVAKELNLPQDKAQQILDKVAPVIQARQTEQLQAAQTEWVQQSQADKEFGGEMLQENLAVAKKALDAFGSPELHKLLNESGLGNHPEIIRTFYRAGKAISEDHFIPSGRANAQPGRDAKRLYPNSNMN